MSEWKPIETAPQDGEMILLWREDWPCPIVGSWDNSWDEPYWRASESILSDIMGEIEHPTHWLRYPTPPSRI